MLKVLIVCFLMALAMSVHLHQYHLVSPQVSKQTAEGIKTKLITVLPLFKNQVLAASLKQDLEQSDDSKRKLKSVTISDAQEIFTAFGLQFDKQFDINKDGVISGEELKSFNKIWQSFVVPK